VYFKSLQNLISEPKKTTRHSRPRALPYYGPFSGTTLVSRCQKKSGLYGATEDTRGRHTNNPAGHHSNRTNQRQRPTSLIPHFYVRCPSCRNLSI